jgi:hypothetical protein
MNDKDIFDNWDTQIVTTATIISHYRMNTKFRSTDDKLKKAIIDLMDILGYDEMWTNEYIPPAYTKKLFSMVFYSGPHRSEDHVEALNEFNIII